MAGPLFAISLILVLSGALKVVSPDSAAGALTVLGVPAPNIAVRLLGGGEMALGVSGLIVAGSVIAGIVAGAYFCFAVVAEVLRRGDKGVASCGCFGRNDTPPSLLHTGVNVLAGVLGVGAVVWPADDLWAVLADQPAAGIPFVALVLLGSYLLFVAFTALPKVFAPPVVAVPSFSVGAELSASTESSPENLDQKNGVANS